VSDPLYSIYADDEDMLELVEMFVLELPDRVQALQSALAAGDSEQLKVLAHQLKGSAGSYGFQVITDAAAILEQSLKSETAQLDEIRHDLDTLVALMKRVTAEPA